MIDCWITISKLEFFFLSTYSKTLPFKFIDRFFFHSVYSTSKRRSLFRLVINFTTNKKPKFVSKGKASNIPDSVKQSGIN